MNTENIYIHYGDHCFRLDKWKSIKNDYFTKPKGGLWASQIDAKFGWKQWNEREHFAECNKENSFIFSLSSDARILLIDNQDILSTLGSDLCHQHGMSVFLDFEKLAKTYDAIDFRLSNDGRLYWSMCGWDCDSILVMHPWVIMPILGGIDMSKSEDISCIVNSKGEIKTWKNT